MSKLRLELTKGEAVRYIAHLDFARALERALRRAKLPVAYSEGFNPHMKMAFASALPVGVTSDAEYLDIELEEAMAAADFAGAFAAQLPEGIGLKRIKELTGKHPALMALVNLAAYTLEVPLTGGEEAAEVAAASMASIRCFNEAVKVLYVKESPKGRREIDVKFYVPEVRGFARPSGGLTLDMRIRITPSGSVKPSEVLNVLIDQFGLPGDREAALINRNGLYVSDGGRDLSPLNVSAG